MARFWITHILTSDLWMSKMKCIRSPVLINVSFVPWKTSRLLQLVPPLAQPTVHSASEAMSLLLPSFTDVPYL